MKLVMVLAITVLICALSPAFGAIDDVIVYNSALGKESIESTLQGGSGAGGANAALDEVVIWNSARTKAQIEDTLVNGYASGASGVGAGIDDVVVWNSPRTKEQIEGTLVNGYSGTAGMTMWWKFNDSGNLIYDEVSSGSQGIVKGTPSSLSTSTPNDATNRAIGGFTSTANWLTANIPQSVYSGWTCEMWVRNPHLNGSAVIWSLTGSENGGGDADNRRLWVNADGSLTMGDRGYFTGIKNVTSGALTWDADKWYQITIVQTYTGSDSHNIKVYRGAKGDTTVSLLLDYGSSTQTASDYWIAVGAHPAGYYSENQGMGGYLGPAAPAGQTMRWSFDDQTNLVYDSVSGAAKGVIKGTPVSASTVTPFNPTGRAAAGFTSTANWLVANTGFGYYQSWTSEMWVRNPQLNGSAVFWSLTSDENGGLDADIRRMWVNADGRLTMGDRGYYTGWQNKTSGALTWDANKWYQITIVQTYTGSNNQNIKVYRGAKGDTSVSLLLDYGSSSFGGNYYLSVGAHPQGYYSDSVGKGGYLGPAEAPTKLMQWSFDDPGNLIYDTVSAGTKGVIKGSPTSIATATPFNPTGRAASGFTSTANWLVAPLTVGYYNSWTSQMWVRNPQLNGSAVFWSLTASENGGGDADIRRMWVNADGSLTMGDRGYNTGINNYSSAPLTWDANKWYQVTVVQTYSGGDSHNIKVYRGAEGDTSVTKLLDYGTSSFGGNYYLSVGAHPIGWVGYADYQGKAGFIGDDVPMLSAPWFSPAGGNITQPTLVTISHPDPAAEIHYTTNGSDPTAGSPVYTEPFTVSASSTTVKALAIKGSLTSQISSATYTMFVEAPVMNPPAGSMNADTPVTITTASSGAEIRYTTNGTEPTLSSTLYTGPVTATDNMTIKAKSFKYSCGSATTSAYYYIPNPLTIDYSNSIVVDGNLSEWSSGDFVALDRLYSVPAGYPGLNGEYAIQAQAWYAAKWKGDKVYVAVKVNDPHPVLSDYYIGSDQQDNIEVYLRAPGSTGPTGYNLLQEAAQQFQIGIWETVPTNSWAVMGGHTPAPGSSGLTTKVSVSGTWLYYEVALTPWLYFGGLKDPVVDNQPCTLKTGDYIGLDVTVSDYTSSPDSSWLGMLAENEIGGKWLDYNNIVLHKLVGGVSYQQMSIANAKNAAAGTHVEINSGAVSQAFTDYFYIETADRSSGIRVNKTAHGRSKSDLITKVTGEIKIDSATGEKYIQAVDALASGTLVIQPLGGSNRGLAGTGLETVGLLVKAWGKVTSLGGGIYSIDDGSGLDLRFQIVSGSFTVDPAKTYSVTGPMSLYKVQPSGPVVKLIIVKDAATDIRQF